MSSIRRSVQVIDLLARRGPLGVRAAAQQLKLPLGSVHRILVDLAEELVVERTPSGEWELSYRLIEITGRQLDRIQWPQLVRPFAERIAEATRETVNVTALSGLAGVCIDKVRGNEGMQLDAPIGSRGPLYCGGAGKAILAAMNDADRERIFAAPLKPLTANTITDHAVLRRELARIRSRGYSLDNEEVVLGVHCVGVPILDRNQRPVGAISISGPSAKKPGHDLDRLVGMLSEACGHISRRLGYGGDWPVYAAASAEAPRRRLGQDQLEENAMMRVAWVMKLKPGNEAIYKRKHDEIWAEMLELMKRQGIRNYSIYRHGLTLFAYLERDHEPPPGEPHDPVVPRWWKMMEPYMEYNADGTPWTEPIEEVFHAD